MFLYKYFSVVRVNHTVRMKAPKLNIAFLKYNFHSLETVSRYRDPQCPVIKKIKI